MNKAQHLKRYPKCRATTLAMIEKQCEMTDRLRKEVEAERRVKLPRSKLMRLLEWFK